MISISMCTSIVTTLAAKELRGTLSPQRCLRRLSSSLKGPIGDQVLWKYLLTPGAQFRSIFHERTEWQLRDSMIISDFGQNQVLHLFLSSISEIISSIRGLSSRMVPLNQRIYLGHCS